MSDFVRPHRRQPTRLRCPWDSPGKNTGVGCHFLLQCMKVKSESEVAQSCLTLSDSMDCSLPGSSVHWDFPGKSTGVGCHCLLRPYTNDFQICISSPIISFEFQIFRTLAYLTFLFECLISTLKLMWLREPFLFMQNLPALHKRKNKIPSCPPFKLPG